MSFYTPHPDNGYDVSLQLVSDLHQRTLANLRRSVSARQSSTGQQISRAKFLHVIAGLAQERPPLAVRVTDRIVCSGYSIEKTSYESLAGHRVAVTCYVPTYLGKPAPAVLAVDGQLQKFQQVCRELASNGFMVLAIDQSAQDERHPSYQFIWNAIRAVDYLVSRHDVDATRIAVSTSSDGAAQTGLLMMCEPRLAVTVPLTRIGMMGTFLLSVDSWP